MTVGDSMCCLRMKSSAEAEALLPVTSVNVIIKALPKTRTASLPFSGVNITFITFYRQSTSIVFSVAFNQGDSRYNFI